MRNISFCLKSLSCEVHTIQNAGVCCLLAALMVGLRGMVLSLFSVRHGRESGSYFSLCGQRRHVFFTTGRSPTPYPKTETHPGPNNKKDALPVCWVQLSALNIQVVSPKLLVLRLCCFGASARVGI